MPKRRWILWEGLVVPSMERMVMTESEDGVELAGFIIQATPGASYLARYAVHVDHQWRTVDAWAEVDDAGAQKKIALTRNSSGEWIADGQAMPQLADCLDVDLEWTPATNTLPIRRLALARGMEATVRAAWIRFPSARVEPLIQSYQRTGERRYHYRSGDFCADLEVDDDSLVLQYGANWRAVATSSRS